MLYKIDSRKKRGLYTQFLSLSVSDFYQIVTQIVSDYIFVIFFFSLASIL